MNCFCANYSTAYATLRTLSWANKMKNMVPLSLVVVRFMCQSFNKGKLCSVFGPSSTQPTCSFAVQFYYPISSHNDLEWGEKTLLIPHQTLLYSETQPNNVSSSLLVNLPTSFFWHCRNLRYITVPRFPKNRNHMFYTYILPMIRTEPYIHIQSKPLNL